MEAPYRFIIANLQDLENFFATLANSPDIVPHSLRLSEGAELLEKQLEREGRPSDRVLVSQAQTITGILALLRELWNHPLSAQQPRFLRFNATLASAPHTTLSVRIDVLTIESLPHWVDAEGDRDPVANSRLIAAYHRLSETSRLRFVQV